MREKNITYFLRRSKIKPSPTYLNTELENWLTDRQYAKAVYNFHDINGIEHYFFRNKDYRRKVLTLETDKNPATNKYPSQKSLDKLEQLILDYIHKTNIIKTEKQNNTLRFEILFLATTSIEDYQKWINNLTCIIERNNKITLKQLSLSIACTDKPYKIIPDQSSYMQVPNKNIKPLNTNLKELNDFELATIGISYQKETDIIPPEDLAKTLGLDDEYSEKHRQHYKKERKEVQ